MKLLAAFLALGLTALCRAQDSCAIVAAKIPSCAQSCIISAGSGVGCGATDFACQCKPANYAKVNSAALQCVVSGCGAQTGLAVQASASAVCDCVSNGGPTSSTMTGAGPATTSASTSGTMVSSMMGSMMGSMTATVASSVSSVSSMTVVSGSTSHMSSATTSMITPASAGSTAGGSTMASTASAIQAVLSISVFFGAFVAFIIAL